MNIVFLILGASLSGKTTLINKIIKKYNFIHPCFFGFLLRNSKDKKIKKYIDEGKYVNNNIIYDIVHKKFNEQHKYIIFDGFPRKFDQTMFFNMLCEKYNYKKIIFWININDEKKIYYRSNFRKECFTCKKNFLSQSFLNKCTFCNGDLHRRNDDSDYNKVINRYYSQKKELSNILLTLMDENLLELKKISYNNIEIVFDIISYYIEK